MLTLDEKMNAAVYRAKITEAEIHFFKQYEPFYPGGFSVGQRNPGHWDIYAQCHPGEIEAHEAVNGPGSIAMGDRERAFRIRGEPGNVIVMDERWDPTRPFPRDNLYFKSIPVAMIYISEQLMFEAPIKNDN